MLQKNYTNPLDKGRYGFSASGKFNAPYKLETLLISVSVASGIVGVVLVVIFAMQFVRSNPTGVDGGRMMEALIGAVILIGAVVILGVTGLVVKVLFQGFACSYVADEEKFVLDYGGAHKSIYYSEVQGIHFLPRTFLGKIHGYTVTVKINGANEEYAVTSDGYISESATPFYILKERMEMLRHEEEVRRLASGVVSQNTEPLTPLKREPSTVMDRVASMLGKDSEMPGVSAGPKPAPEQPNCPENGTSIAELITKLSTSAVEPDGDMPAVNAGGEVFGNVPSFIDLDGRGRSVYDIIASGNFRVLMKPAKAAFTVIFAVLIYAALAVPMISLVMNIRDYSVKLFNGLNPAAPMALGIFLLVIAIPIYAAIVVNIIKNGDTFTYKANGHEFVVTAKNKSEERILYSDVQDVVYNRRKILWLVKGYRIEIVTRYGIIKYNYVCEGRRFQSEKSLPFEVIRERIPNKQ